MDDPEVSGRGGMRVSVSARGSTAPELGPGREFDLIRAFVARSRRLPAAVKLGPGDDAAVVTGENLVLSVDLSIEDVHFRRSWLDPVAIGARAAAAALSDLAAMAARPIGLLVSLAVTRSDAEEIATEIMRGVDEIATSVGAGVLGGDLTRSPGPIILDVVVVGEAPAPIGRGGAQPGDELWVTGELGASGLAVGALSESRPVDPAAYRRFAAPVPRVREALWLSERSIPRAMLDLSDGLASDASHLAAASDLRVVIETEALPIHPSVTDTLDRRDAIDLALAGGEDYELCFAARPGTVDPFVTAFRDEFGLMLRRVGSFDVGQGVAAVDSTGVRSLTGVEGFQHFRGAD